MGETGFNEKSFKTAVTSAAMKNPDTKLKTQGMFFSNHNGKTSRTILEVPHATPDILQNNSRRHQSVLRGGVLQRGNSKAGGLPTMAQQSQVRKNARSPEVSRGNILIDDKNKKLPEI